MKSYPTLLLLCLVMQFQAAAQWKAGIEQYSYTGMPMSEAIVPICHIQSNNNWYAELRYNYEDAKTMSFYTGKIIQGGNDLEFSVTPMLGFSVGRFTSVALAANSEISWKHFFFSSQSQYSRGIKDKASSFLFNWSELGYTISPHLFTGVSVQYTRQGGQNSFEPGILAGFTFNQLSFPFYVFNPLRDQQYFVLGINYEYHFKKRR